MGPLRILTIAPTPFFADRGCHVRILEEASELQRRGHRVLVCSYHLGRDPEGLPVRRIAQVPWYKKLSAGPSWHKLYLDLLLLRLCWRSVRDFRPDLLHGHLHEGAAIGLMLRGRFGLPLLFDCQGSLGGELAEHGCLPSGSLFGELVRRVEGGIDRGADRVAASSAAVAGQLVDDFGVPQQRVSLLADGVDTGFFRPLERDPDLVRELGLAEDRKLVVYLGAMGGGQGIGLLLEAARLLTDRRQDLHFLLMGYPDAGWKKRAAELGLERQVTFAGRIDYRQTPRYLALGDVAVTAKISSSEANAKLLVYMACGLATVAFDTPVNRELLGEDGLLVSPGEAAGLASGIETLIDDPQRRLQLSQRLRRRAESEHGMVLRGAELEAICRELVASGKRS